MKKPNESFTFKDRLYHWLSRAKGIGLETDPDLYEGMIKAVKGHDFSRCNDNELSGEMIGARNRIASGESAEALLAVVFALVYESAKRALGIIPYDEQLAAGIALHFGKLAEMQTGEGKTLAIVFAACMAACEGKAVHVFTANDYLASRDAEWMGGIYSILGFSAMSAREGMGAAAKKAAYGADVTYVTAKEAGFDFLRDGLCTDPRDTVHRGFESVIVDEADFLLVDESRVPLVIAREDESSAIDLRRVDDIVRKLCPHEDFETDRSASRVYLTMQGEKRVASLIGCEGMHEEKSAHLYAAVNVALYARELLARDRDYIVREGRIELVDELTGRVASERRWPYGIQAALRVKEGLPAGAEGKIYGRIIVRHFMGLYEKIAAITATALPAASELHSSYGLDVVVIPQHKACMRKDEPDVVFACRREKMARVADEVARVHANGRPVLVGTVSVSESEELSGLLAERGVRAEVLNAKNDTEEAVIIARAGMPGAVTVSTNMAGRGVDIMLGGETGEERARVESLGGLYVIGTNRHESARTDNQLRGRAGRQGDPGTSRFFVSLEDDLFVKYGIREFIPGKYLQGRSFEPISDKVVHNEINRAQAIIEAEHGRIRRLLYRYSEIIEKQRLYLYGIRTDALVNRELPEPVIRGTEKKIESLSVARYGIRADEALAILFMDSLDRFWASHLELVEDLREGIYLRRLAGKEPLLEFIREADKAFSSGLEDAYVRAIDSFGRASEEEIAAIAEKKGAAMSSSTWTYTVSDDPFPSFNVGMFASRMMFAIVAGIMEYLVYAPVAAIRALFGKRKTKRHEAFRNGRSE